MPDAAPFGETPRLLLREFVPADWQAVLVYASDPDVLRFKTTAPASALEVQAGLSEIRNQQKAVPRTRYEMAIVRKDTGVLIGWLPLLLDADLRQAEVGWTLARAHWGHGFATEAAQFALSFAFETLKLHRVWARCVPENTASWRIMEKIGMRREGCHKQSVWLKNAWVDNFVYAVLREP